MTTARFIAGLVKRNNATASGSTTSAFLGSTPRSSDDFNIAGRLASELCVLIATAKVGTIARRKRGAAMPTTSQASRRRWEGHTCELEVTKAPHVCTLLLRKNKKT